MKNDDYDVQYRVQVKGFTRIDNARLFKLWINKHIRNKQRYSDSLLLVLCFPNDQYIIRMKAELVHESYKAYTDAGYIVDMPTAVQQLNAYLAAGKISTFSILIAEHRMKEYCVTHYVESLHVDAVARYFTQRRHTLKLYPAEAIEADMLVNGDYGQLYVSCRFSNTVEGNMYLVHLGKSDGGARRPYTKTDRIDKLAITCGFRNIDPKVSSDDQHHYLLDFKQFMTDPANHPVDGSSVAYVADDEKGIKGVSSMKLHSAQYIKQHKVQSRFGDKLRPSIAGYSTFPHLTQTHAVQPTEKELRDTVNAYADDVQAMFNARTAKYRATLAAKAKAASTDSDTTETDSDAELAPPTSKRQKIAPTQPLHIDITSFTPARIAASSPKSSVVYQSIAVHH